MAKLLITIEGGKITSEVSGVKGAGCEAIDAFLKDLGEVESNEKTAEYHEKEVVKRDVRQNA